MDFSDSGIGLEGGVYVTAIAAGSPAAREGSLNIGDRLIAVSLQWPALFDQNYSYLLNNGNTIIHPFIHKC